MGYQTSDSGVGESAVLTLTPLGMRAFGGAHCLGVQARRRGQGSQGSAHLPAPVQCPARGSRAQVHVSSGSQGSGLQASKGFSGSGLQGSDLRGFRGPGSQGFRCPWDTFCAPGTQGFKGSGLQGFRGSSLHGFCATEIQGLRGSVVQGFKASGVLPQSVGR